MPNYTFDQLFNIFRALPESVREVLVSIDTIKIMQEIATKHALHLDQANTLAQETGYIMLGLAERADFARTLRTALGIDDAKAQEIVADVNTRLFTPIQEDLKHSREIKDKVMLSEAEELEGIRRGEFSLEKKDEDGGEAPSQAGTSAPTRDVFQEKMGRLFHAPKTGTSTPTTTNQQVSDPYREIPQ